MKKISVSLVVFVLLLSGLSKPGVALGTDFVTPSLVIGSLGSGQGEFDNPDSVYVDANGMIFAGDTNNQRIQVFDSNGVYQYEITGFSATPAANEVQGIGELSDGTLVVIEKIGNLYFFNKATGALLNKVNIGDNATGDAVDTQGLVVDTTTDLIYITNQPEHMIMVINADGNVTEEIYVGDFTTPENMALDVTRGRIYVSAEGLGRVVVLDFDGNRLADFGKDESSFNYEGLAIDSNGNIWAVDEGADQTASPKPSRLTMFDPVTYAALYSFGGETPGTAIGKFLSPDGLAYDSLNNRLVIVDQGNNRLQLFDMTTILAQSATYTEPTVPDETTSNEKTSEGEEDTSIPFISIVGGFIAVAIFSKRRLNR